MFLYIGDITVTVTAEDNGFCVGMFFQSLFHIEMVAVRIRKSNNFQVKTPFVIHNS